MVVGVCAQFLANIAFALRELRTRILFLFLHFGIFLFWLTRPTIGICYGTEAWLGDTWDVTVFTFMIIYFTMAFLLAGSYCYSQRKAFRRPSLTLSALNPPARHGKAKPPLAEGFESSAFLHAVRVSAFAVFALCCAFAFVHGVQLLSYMSGRVYEEYYLVDSSGYSSSLVSSLAGMTVYALGVYLATMPKRRPATVALLLFVATTLPELVIGARGSFAMAALFLVFYYLFRQQVSKDEQWITRTMAIVFLIALPLGIVGLGIVNYTRAGSDFRPENLLLQFADTLYKQGVTFKTLQYGYEVNDSIQALGPRFYLLGGLIDSVTQGFIGQQFLGCELYPAGNNLRLALNGSQYAHAMSAFAHPNYLGGEGYGSAYVLEAYADLGMGGVLLVSFGLGFVLAAVSGSMGRRFFPTLLGVMAGYSVFHMARGSALEWAGFLWSTRFWLTLVLILAFAYVLSSFSGNLFAASGPPVIPRPGPDDKGGAPPCARFPEACFSVAPGKGLRAVNRDMERRKAEDL